MGIFVYICHLFLRYQPEYDYEMCLFAFNMFLGVSFA